MKKLFFIAIAIVAAACTSHSTQTNINDSITTADKSAVKPDSISAATNLKFVYTEGQKQQDSTVVEFTVNNQKVSGTMNWLPYQKDSRKGKLAGTIHGDTLNATWSFMQEGMADTLALKFLLKNGQLSQKPLKLNVKTGRQQTDELAGYTMKYQTGNVGR